VKLQPYKARLAGKRVLLITGGVKSWSVVAALQEVGIEIVAPASRNPPLRTSNASRKSWAKRRT